MTKYRLLTPTEREAFGSGLNAPEVVLLAFGGTLVTLLACVGVLTFRALT